MHGGLQLVPRGVLLSQATSETRALSCNINPSGWWHSKGTASDKLEEGAGDGRSVCPESPGLHADYNEWYNGLRLREEKEISKTIPSSDCGLQPTHMKPESLVIACHHRAVNMSLLLAHTARQATRVGSG